MKFKEKKGITLVALVVTIIVLIILAGVSINLVLGERGILNRARNGRNNYQVASNEEAVKLTGGGDLIDSWIDGNGRGSGGGEDDQLDATGDVRITEFSIAGTPVTNVPLPSTDFEKVPNTEIDNSYVARGKIGTSYEGDEFVWVPVDKNQQFTVIIEGSGDISSVVLKNPVGDNRTIANNITAPTKLEHILPTMNDEVYNGMYEITITTENGNTIKKYIAVHSLYAVDIFNDYYATEDGINAYMEAKGIPNREYVNTMLKTYGLVSSDNPTNEEIGMAYGEITQRSGYNDPSDTFATNVAENGGFWIGRYEASHNINTAKPSSKTSSYIGSDSSSPNQGQLWNYISKGSAISAASGYNSELNSYISTGAAWDRTIGWIYEKRNSTGKSLSDIMKNSSSWGNYSNDTFSGTSELINTGSKIETMANNIYDLAGNLAEWTTETPPSGYYTQRGGNYNTAGTDAPVTDRTANMAELSQSQFGYQGFRIVLYK